MSKKANIPYLSTAGKTLETLQRELETQGQRISIDTLNWEHEFPYRPLVAADLAYSEEGIILHFFVHGEDIRTLSPGDGNYVHEDSCVEFFMQREAGESYINFEFNAAGVCYASHHKTVQDSTLLSEAEFASIKRIATYQGERLEQTEGIYNWEVTALIPWAIMGYAEAELPSSMRANLYKCGDKTAHPHFVSWAPITEEQPAFHRPQFFGELYFLPKK